MIRIQDRISQSVLGCATYSTSMRCRGDNLNAYFVYTKVAVANRRITQCSILPRGMECLVGLCEKFEPRTWSPAHVTAAVSSGCAIMSLCIEARVKKLLDQADNYVTYSLIKHFRESTKR